MHTGERRDGAGHDAEMETGLITVAIAEHSG